MGSTHSEDVPDESPTTEADDAETESSNCGHEAPTGAGVGSTLDVGPGEGRRPPGDATAGVPEGATTEHGGMDGPPVSDLEVLRALDSFLDDIDTDLPTARKRARARDQFELETRLGEPTTTQEHLGFDYVRDDGIAVDDDSYIGLLQVHPQNWLSLSDAEKRETMSAYMSFLMNLEFSVAVPCYPKDFDLTDHLERFYLAGTSMRSRGESPILQYGRKFYIQWASTNIDEAGLKQRDFYIVTRVRSEHVNKSLETGSALSQLRRVPLLGSLYSELVERSSLEGDTDEERTARCIREIRERQRRIINTLGRTDVSIERVTDRQKTMEILYHYYNHVDPNFDEFSHATATEGESQ